MSLPRLDALESELLQHLHAALQTGQGTITAQELIAFLVARKAERRTTAIIARFVSRGYLRLIPMPTAEELRATGTPEAMRLLRNWHQVYGNPLYERWSITGAVLDEYGAVVAAKHTEPEAQESLNSMPPAARRVYVLYLDALATAHREATTLATDREAYDWMTKRVTDYKLPTFLTFARYLGMGRRATGTQKHRPRKIYTPTRSMKRLQE
jgi:hypothetical protein